MPYNCIVSLKNKSKVFLNDKYQVILLKWIRFTNIISLQTSLIIKIDYFVKMHLRHFINQNTSVFKVCNFLLKLGK